MAKKTNVSMQAIRDSFEAHVNHAIEKNGLTNATTLTFQTKDMAGILSYIKQLENANSSILSENTPNNPNTKTIYVKLLNKSELSTSVLAGLTCTNNENNIENYNKEEFLRKLIEAGHTSVLEHIVYSFSLAGFSRAVLQELSRHRHISQSVLSTRWALKKMNLDYFVPSNMDPTDEEEYKTHTEEMLEMARRFSMKYGNDTAKYCIPESVFTKEVLTVNARELMHIFSLRTSKRALKEFQDLCRALFDEIPIDHKFMYKKYFNE